MATISGSTNEKIFRITAWHGINENPDGDTKLKLGEAAVMRNFAITRDNNLRRRRGSALIKGLRQSYSVEVTDETYSKKENVQMLLYSEVSATTDGFLQMSGGGELVTPEEASDYIGWFHLEDRNHIYKLISAESAEEGFMWSFRRVKATGSGNAPVSGMWSGRVAEHDEFIAACDGKLWRLYDDTTGNFIKQEIGNISTTSTVHMFGFSNNLYVMNGTEYKVWDGTTFKAVDGYRPLVVISLVPSGGGETLEQINKLTGARRAWISPDGESRVFQLPEKGLLSLDYVKDLKTGSTVPASSYTFNLADGTVTFISTPQMGTNSYEIGWTMGTNYRSQVLSMRFSELYSGTQNTRVFIYGDGSNKALYSELDYDGKPRADYFPDLNEVAVGEENSPITAMIRHYGNLICYKKDSTWAISYGVVTLADESLTPAFYSTPINKTIGNEALGQTQLVLNSPRTLHGKDLYEWKNNASYASNLSIDERQAKRISDRIHGTLSTFNIAKCHCWDDNDHQEYYVCYDGKAVVNNYASDAWYTFTNFDAVCFANFKGELYFGTSDGRVEHFSYNYLTDDGDAIPAYWESGSLDFGQDYMRKYSAMLWIGIKPESSGEVTVTAQTDKKSHLSEKIVASSLASFANAKFARWSFSTNRKPQIWRLKIKAKKFVFYKLIFEADTPGTTATILTADIRVRYTGYAK